MQSSKHQWVLPVHTPLIPVSLLLLTLYALALFIRNVDLCLEAATQMTNLVGVAKGNEEKFIEQAKTACNTLNQVINRVTESNIPEVTLLLILIFIIFILILISYLYILDYLFSWLSQFLSFIFLYSYHRYPYSCSCFWSPAFRIYTFSHIHQPLSFLFLAWWDFARCIIWVARASQ